MCSKNRCNNNRCVQKSFEICFFDKKINTANGINAVMTAPAIISSVSWTCSPTNPARATGSEVVDIIGNVLIIYWENMDRGRRKIRI